MFNPSELNDSALPVLPSTKILLRPALATSSQKVPPFPNFVAPIQYPAKVVLSDYPKNEPISEDQTLTQIWKKNCRSDNSLNNKLIVPKPKLFLAPSAQ